MNSNAPKYNLTKFVHNPDTDFSYKRKLSYEKARPYNLLHLNALYDINSHTYVDAIINKIGESGENKALFGECKWTNDKVDVGVLQKLESRRDGY